MWYSHKPLRFLYHITSNSLDLYTKNHSWFPKKILSQAISTPYPFSFHYIGPTNSQPEVNPSVRLLCTHIDRPGCPRECCTITWVNAMTDSRIISFSDSNVFCTLWQILFSFPWNLFQNLTTLFKYLHPTFLHSFSSDDFLLHKGNIDESGYSSMNCPNALTQEKKNWSL